MKRKSLFLAVITVFSAILFVQCSKDDEPEITEKGTLAVKITDAPSDDPTIQGTFITVANVKVNGVPVEGFTKQTIEISAYQKGKTKLLISEEVAAKSYNQITLVLDQEADVTGNAPGCYVLTTDNEKHDLFTDIHASGEITVSKSFEVTPQGETAVVIDFDLRKAVVRNQTGTGTSNYQFVTSAELKNAVRVVKESECGELRGTVSYDIWPNAQTYLFVYKKGEFNATTESTGSGSSGVLFAKAVTSANVESDGKYKLPFLEAGDYEIHLASFDKNAGNQFTFSGLLNATSTINGLLLNQVSVSANATIQLDIEIETLF